MSEDIEAIVRPEEMEGIHFWLLKFEDQRCPPAFILVFRLARITWFMPPWRASKRALERQEILTN
jgi:hypothetical protein